MFFHGGEMSKHKWFKLMELIFFLLLIIVFSHCARKIFVRQLPTFSPEKMNNIATITDFSSVKGETVNINRSKDLGDKLVAEVTKHLSAKKYVVAKRQLTSVGLYFEDQTNVLDGSGKKSISEPPIYVEKDINQDVKLKEALVSSFKEIDKVIKPYKGKKVEEKFLYTTDIFLGENSRFLGQYLGTDTLLFLYAWETKKSDASKFISSLGWAAGMALQGVLMADLSKTEYYEPDPVTFGGIYAAVGFISAMTINSDGYTACCGVVVDAESGKATWYNFSHWASGGMSGNQIRRLAKDLLKKLPEKR
jgi:hypothetical protein